TQIKNYQSLPVVQSNIGLAYVHLGKPHIARKYFEESFAGHKKFGNKKEQAFTLIELGRLAKSEGKFEKAINRLNEALKMAAEANVIQQQIDAHQVLAAIYASQGNYSQAYNHQAKYMMFKDSVYRIESAKAMENFAAQYETEKKEQQIKMLSQTTTIQNLELEQRNLYV